MRSAGISGKDPLEVDPGHMDSERIDRLDVRIAKVQRPRGGWGSRRVTGVSAGDSD